MAINARQAVAKSGKKATIKNIGINPPKITPKQSSPSTVTSNPNKRYKKTPVGHGVKHSVISKVARQKKTKLIKGGGTMTLY